MIEYLNFSARTYNALKRSGVDTIQELLQLQDSELLGMWNIGAGCLREIRTKIPSPLAGPADLAAFNASDLCYMVLLSRCPRLFRSRLPTLERGKPIVIQPREGIVYALRLAGLTYKEIGVELEVSGSRAREIWLLAERKCCLILSFDRRSPEEERWFTLLERLLMESAMGELIRVIVRGRVAWLRQNRATASVEGR